MFTNGIDDQKLSKFLCFLVFSIILRFNSIIIFPIILVFVFFRGASGGFLMRKRKNRKT